MIKSVKKKSTKLGVHCGWDEMKICLQRAKQWKVRNEQLFERDMTIIDLVFCLFTLMLV